MPTTISGDTGVSAVQNGAVDLTTDVSGVLPVANGGNGTATANASFKNRIINGAMVIDQRNAGAAVTLSTAVVFPVDRFVCYRTTSGAVATGQRSNVAPANFINSLLYNVTTGATISSTDYNQISHIIEGLNVADLGWGTANAQTITLSFWVRSSVTGTYGVSVGNSSDNRLYVGSYVINSSNTWEYKTVTIPGDTSGTWLTTNGSGLILRWDLGIGTTYSGSAGSWSSSNTQGLTGGVKLIQTTGATFYITGVQLEKGSTATSFDYRPYGTELALCQRYYQKITPNSTSSFASGAAYFTNNPRFHVPTLVQMRSSATATFPSASSFQLQGNGGNTVPTVIAQLESSVNSVYLSFTSTSTTNIPWSLINNSGAYIELSSEL